MKNVAEFSSDNCCALNSGLITDDTLELLYELLVRIHPVRSIYSVLSQLLVRYFDFPLFDQLHGIDTVLRSCRSQHFFLNENISVALTRT